MDEATISELIDRARNGDSEAQSQLFERCRNYLNFIARAQIEGAVQQKFDASDVVQQTMLEAHRDFMRFRGATEAEWLGWLKRILSHNAADLVRQFKGTEKRQLNREVSLRANKDGSSLNLDPRDPGESPSQVVMRREREVEVADALAKLSPDHQEVILLRNLQHLPFDQVAERMNRSRPAVQMLWMRALRKLQDILGEPA